MGEKPGEKLFKKGNKGGPGRPKIPKDLQKAKKLSRTVVEVTLSKYLLLPADKLSETLKDTSLPILDQVVLRVCAQAIKEGDSARLNFLLDRIIGKVPAEDRVIPVKF